MTTTKTMHRIFSLSNIFAGFLMFACSVCESLLWHYGEHQTRLREYMAHICLHNWGKKKLAASQMSLAAFDSSKNQSSSQIIHIRDVWVALVLADNIISHKIIIQSRHFAFVCTRSDCILFCISISESKPLDKGNWVELSNSGRSMETENTQCYSQKTQGR